MVTTGDLRRAMEEATGRTVCPEGARARAALSEHRLAAGDVRGLRHDSQKPAEQHRKLRDRLDRLESRHAPRDR